ncbi:translocation/assembly module TamB domain-containing protein [Tateyamaria omphalii]|uniref:translocation/assembly module TamB domain-containing protein n=1 Tax=Tateyamaria omphalii TaxID=299262 RepID=UPI001C996138|nr:translocation/assembly module TamB domain-containing protein [Tateyamaria omphalii]MBY5931758.1 translocation/assembly module TamB domain-containing protein [Tateyamaria omphalii]
MAGTAQDDEDRGFLVGLLESSLGGEGRIVRIDGFAGALSSRATIERITIADSEGIWLTLEDVAMQWNRSALFRATIDIQELRAARIDLPRLPVAQDSDLPAPEAAPFSLPDLPAAVRIAQLELGSVSLGAPILGEAAVLSVSGAAELAGGAGNATLNATRTDGPRGSFDVTAAYANDTRDLTLDLGLSEAENGLVSGVLNLPDRPSVDLVVDGSGALSDFDATLDLRTDDTPRLAGTLALQSEAGGPMAFDAALDGDISALVLPEYRDFFGTDVALEAQGSTDANGALALDTFALEARAIQLAGQVGLNSDGWPTLLDIQGRLRDPDGTAVALPGAGGARVAEAALDIAFDAGQSDALQARITASGLDQDGNAVDDMALFFDGTLTGAVGSIGALDGRLNLSANGIALSDTGLARAVGQEVRGGLNIAYADDAPLRLTDLALTGAAWALGGSVEMDGFDEALETSFETSLSTRDLSAFAELAGLDLSGAGDLSASGTAALGGFFDVTITGQTRDLGLGIEQADALLEGRTDLVVAARRDTTGTVLDRLTLENSALNLTASADLSTGASTARFNASLADVGLITDAVEGPITVDGTATQSGGIWDVSGGLTGPLDTSATGTARISDDQSDISLDAVVEDLERLVPQITEPVRLTATAAQRNGAWQFETNIDGPAEAEAAVTGLFDGGRLSARYDVSAPNLSAFAPGVPGGGALNGDIRQTADGWAFDTDLSGPYDSTGTLSGTFEDVLVSDFDLSIPNVAAIAPGVRGPLNLDGTLSQTPDGWDVVTDVAGPYSSTGRVSASLTDGVAAARYALSMPNVAPLVPGLNGGASVNGTLQQVGDAFDIDTQIAGPSGTTAKAAGQIRPDGTLNINTQGQLQLGLVNPFITPRTILGTARFDLAVNGQPALSSVSGQITTQGARVATPNLPVSISDLSGTVRLSGGQAALDFKAAITEGGSVAISGPITLNGSYPAQLAVGLNAVLLRDPTLYSTTVDGQVNLSGPLTGGAAISGQLNLGETNVQVPSTGIASFGAIPDITHIGATRPVMRTQARAGLVQDESTGSGTGAAYPLDLTINAPNRIFIRGRGLDAELGGQLRLSGTTADIISTGQFDLIRGRLSILAQRFTLDEGRITLQGRFEPILLFVVETDTSTGTARIIVDGPADDPDVRFEATPEAPEDQVLAQIIFGRDISQLSAFQALQLASAVASLAGAGGEGIVSQLRGSFGLDDLDVASDDEGNTAVRAGRYLSENVYTDVTVGGADGPEVSLNIDLTPNITARGSVSGDGNTGIGIFIERDY